MLTKRCTGCLLEKPLASYGKNSGFKNGLHCRCRACHKVESDAWYNANKAVVAARRRERYYANLEAKRADGRIRARKYIAQKRDQCRAATKRWREENPAKSLAQCALRRLRINAGPVEEFSRGEIWDRDKGICHVCSTACDSRRWHLDHIKPLAKGGSHVRSNVAVAHPFCNQSKGASHAISR
jgi:5-methylcytosine-specific restriction endonuclease McrA